LVNVLAFLKCSHWVLISSAISYICLNNINQDIRGVFGLERAHTFGFYIKEYFGYEASLLLGLFLLALTGYCCLAIFFDLNKNFRNLNSNRSLRKISLFYFQFAAGVAIFLSLGTILVGRYRSCFWNDFGGGEGSYLFWAGLSGYLLCSYLNGKVKSDPI
jgi:hypothetical protein